MLMALCGYRENILENHQDHLNSTFFQPKTKNIWIIGWFLWWDFWLTSFQFVSALLIAKSNLAFLWRAVNLDTIFLLLKWMISLRCNVLQKVERETLLSTKLFNCIKETEAFEALRTILHSSLLFKFLFLSDLLLVPYVFGEFQKFWTTHKLRFTLREISRKLNFSLKIYTIAPYSTSVNILPSSIFTKKVNNCQLLLIFTIWTFKPHDQHNTR